MSADDLDWDDDSEAIDEYLAQTNPRNECARCGEESPEVYQDDSYTQICDVCAGRDE